MMKKIGFFFLIGIFITTISLTIGLPKITLAKLSNSADFSTATQKHIYVGSDEIINDNFVRVGEIVDVNGTINGDILVAGGTVNINSNVQGDVIAAAATVRIKGDIAGNVRVIGSSVEIDATIGKNANLFGGTISISEDSLIGWSLVYWSGTANIRGTVGGHIDGGAEQTMIAAKVGGNANIRAEEGGIITINPPATIGGNLTYWGNIVPTIDEDAEIKGEVIQKSAIFPSLKKNIFEFLGISKWFFRLIDLFGLMVVGLITISFFKKTSISIIERMKKEPAKNIGWGIVYLIVIPIATLLLSLTIIGIPLALITAALYVIAAYISKLFIGLMLGYYILLSLKKNKKDQSIPLMWAMILGIVVYTLIIMIPYIGWLISIVGTIWAFGALLEIIKKQIKENI